jgi:NADPH:quinone reductase
MAAQLPETMKAAVVDRPGPAGNVQIKRVPVPRLARRHVIIALDYAGIGPWDTEQRAGEWGEIKAGTILGADGSGYVAAVSSDVTHVRAGDRVYAYSYQNADGGFHAEYVSVPADCVERVPEQIDQRVAGAMPCVAITALSGLRELKPKEHSTLCVFGASGGVGSLAVWLAAHAFKTAVAGTARPDAHAYIRTAGAAHALDPRASQIEGVLKRVSPDGFDALLATAGGDDLAPFLRHLRPKAPFAYPNGVEPEPHIDGHRAIAFDGLMSRDVFQNLNAAIGAQTIPLRIEEFALDDVVQAHRRMEQGHVIGKIVLRIR